MHPQVFPVIGAIPDNFGWDGNPFDGDPGFNPDDSHSGHDIFGTNGQQLVSSTPGTVTKAGWVGGGGYRVGITDPDGWYHYYAHMQEGSIAVSVGQHVEAGQFIGLMNQSGEAAGTAPHLHYGIRVDGTWLHGFYQALIDAFNRSQTPTPQPIPPINDKEEDMLKGRYVEVPDVSGKSRIAVTNSTRKADGSGDTINVAFAFLNYGAGVVFTSSLKMKPFQTHYFYIRDGTGVPADFSGTCFMAADKGEITARVREDL